MSAGARRLVAGLRGGAWLTLRRIRAYSVICLVLYGLAIAATVATVRLDVDRWGRPVGTDFSSFWVAGRSALAGRAAQPYDPALQAAAERAAFPASARLAGGANFYAFAYPPYFLLLLAPLALLPYLAALAAWLAATFAFYAAMMWRLLPRGPALLAALAFPAVLVNLGHGQNGFLTAALLGGGVALLPRRPVLAGVLFGLLACKPQLGLALPVALLVGGHWRAIAAAVATLAALVGASLLAFGPAAWRAFFAGAAFARTSILVEGEVGWAKMQSIYAGVRLLGGGVAPAAMVQAAATLAVLAALGWLWMQPAPWRLRAAGLIVATLLATPFCLDYDMMLLAPALALLAADGLAHGFAPWERSALAALWVLPLVARTIALATAIPLGALGMILLFGLILARARRAVTLAPIAAA